MLASILLAFINLLGFSAVDSSQYAVVIGSYTREGNAGIEVFDANLSTGKTSRAYSLKNPNASYQAISADTRYLFSVTEEGKGKSSVSAYARNNRGEYSFINSSSTIGDGPCFVAYREASKTVYAANYGAGSLSVFKTENGRLLPIAQHIEYKGSSVVKGRQEAPHAHNIVISPDQHYLYVVDLGTDNIHQHKIYADGLVDEKSVDIPVPAGNGPRHMVFNQNGTHAYLINELSGTVNVFAVANGRFNIIQEIAADTAAASPKGSADIHISPSGKWLLSSNRVTSNEVTVFAIQPDGLLKKTSHQPVARRPRNFSFDPTGKFVFVASQEDNKVQVFAFDDNTGSMRDTKQDIQVNMPVCINFIKKETDPEEQIKALKIALIPPVPPIANYVKCVQVGNMVYLSGHGPDKAGGGQVLGKLGKDLSIEQGQEAARLTGISLLSTLKGCIGDLGRVHRIVKVLGLVNSEDGFSQQPMVMNGFSNLMVDVFGVRGKHARSAIGTNALPGNIAVEIEMIVELKY
jgi:6-phosphogluconolactonase (cycloisomerase 2 family)/enamine deaminase RidA (YjgF/YER057c/UK114 family)